MRKNIDITVSADIEPVKSLRQQLTEANREVQNLSNADIVDEAKLQEAINKAAELKDRFGDANDAVKELASGSDFEKIKNSIGGVGNSLKNLNFDKATQSAKNLTTTISNLNPATMATQFSAFAGTVAQLGKAVGMLTVKFVQMGIALLTNPIFLLVAAITAIVAGIILLMHKLGILQPILDALMKPIRMLIDGFYALTDAIGLTNKAGEKTREEVEKSIEAYEEQAKVLEKTNSREEFIANDKLRRLKALDDGTQEYAEKIKASEREVLQLKVDNFKEEVRLAENQMLLLLAKGAITKAEYDKQKEQILDLRQQMRSAATDLFEFDNKKPSSKLDTKPGGKKSTIPEKVEEDPIVKYEIQRNRFLEDLDIEAIVDENERAIKQQQVRLRRAQEDLERSEIWATYSVEQQERIQNENLIRINAVREDFNEKQRQKELEETERQARAIADLELQYRQMTIDSDDWEGRQQLVRDRYDLELQDLEKALEDKLISIEEYNAKVKIAGVNLANEENTINKQKADYETKINNDKNQAIEKTTSDLLASVSANAKEGSVIAKAVAVGQATMDTYKAAISAYSSVAGIPVVGPGLGVAAAGAATAFGIASVRKILSTKIPGGGSGGGGSTPTAVSSSNSFERISPNVMFNQNPNNNSVQSANPGSTNITLENVLSVSETEITDVQRRNMKLQNRGAI
jgi:hypothetical protein